MTKVDFIDEKGYVSTGTIEMPNYSMTDIFSFSPEERSGFYVTLTKTYSSFTIQAKEELLAWEFGETNLTDNPPNYRSCIQEELDKLKLIRSHYKLEKIYHDGYFDTEKAGALLGALHPFPEEQKSATISLAKIQFIAEREKAYQEKNIILHPPLDNENAIILQQQKEEGMRDETAFLRYMMKELKLPVPRRTKVKYGELEFRQGQVLVAFYQYCEDTDKICVHSVQEFASKLQPLIAPGKTANSLQQQMGRANEEIGKARIKTLTALAIKKAADCSGVLATQRYDQWHGLYDIVKEIAEHMS